MSEFEITERCYTEHPRWKGKEGNPSEYEKEEVAATALRRMIVIMMYEHSTFL